MSINDKHAFMSKSTNNKGVIKKRIVDIANKNSTLINKVNRKALLKNEGTVMLTPFCPFP